MRSLLLLILGVPLPIVILARPLVRSLNVNGAGRCED